MRRLAISCFTLTMLSTASIAQAQSSVTLYGEIDDALAYYNNVGHASLVTMQGADLATNQWGIKGKEDLGGGFQAIFNLENGFDINTGKLRQGGREFGKNAWVGLASASLAITFNQIASQIGKNIPGLGILLAIFILLVGHALNLLLGIISGFVHGLRLNYIEFFKWAISEEGYPFIAFRKKEVNRE